MLDHAREKIDRFFGSEPEASPGDSSSLRWTFEADPWLLFFRAFPRSNRVRIRLAVHGMAVVDLDLRDLTGIELIDGECEALEIRCQPRDLDPGKHPETCYQVTVSPKIHISQSEKKLPVDFSTRSLFAWRNDDRPEKLLRVV